MLTTIVILYAAKKNNIVNLQDFDRSIFIKVSRFSFNSNILITTRYGIVGVTMDRHVWKLNIFMFI